MIFQQFVFTWNSLALIFRGVNYRRKNLNMIFESFVFSWKSLIFQYFIVDWFWSIRTDENLIWKNFKTIFQFKPHLYIFNIRTNRWANICKTIKINRNFRTKSCFNCANFVNYRTFQTRTFRTIRIARTFRPLSKTLFLLRENLLSENVISPIWNWSMRFSSNDLHWINYFPRFSDLYSKQFLL